MQARALCVRVAQVRECAKGELLACAEVPLRCVTGETLELGAVVQPALIRCDERLRVATYECSSAARWVAMMSVRDDDAHQLRSNLRCAHLVPL